MGAVRLSQYNPIDIERVLRATAPAPPFPPVSDRESWTRVGNELGVDTVRQLIERGEACADGPVPALPATLYLEFERTGQREGYQEPLRRRRAMLAHLALAELLEDGGRFLDPLLDVAWAICEEASWAMPAHQRVLADPAHPVIDLSAAMTAFGLAELVTVLGERLDPALSAFVRHEVDRRCLTPYLTRHDHWWMHNTQLRRVNNWTAVCTAGVVGAAIHLEPDPARLAEIIARGARSLDDYLDTFDVDGGSSEGPGYWSYGFGYYTLLAHLVEHRTDGELGFLDGDRIRAIAQYPGRTQLSPRRYVPFSDCDPDVGFSPSQLAFLSRRLDLPDVMALAGEQGVERRAGELVWAIRALFWRPEPTDPFVPSAHDWFSGMMWMLARTDPSDPDALVLAIKGGHNAEMHNQNDVGSVIVHIGGESVIVDPGRGRYTKSYFGPERYNHLANSSLGHSVPVPNGQAQLGGQQHGATLLDHHADETGCLLRLDLAAAYPAEADLKSLVRTTRLHRSPSGSWLELHDEATFGAPGTLESVLVTFGSAEVDDSHVVLRGTRGALRIGYDPEAVTARVDTVEGVDLSSGPTDVRRVVFVSRQPAERTSVLLHIEPTD